MMLQLEIPEKERITKLAYSCVGKYVLGFYPEVEEEDTTRYMGIIPKTPDTVIISQHSSRRVLEFCCPVLICGTLEELRSKMPECISSKENTIPYVILNVTDSGVFLVEKSNI